MKICKIFVVLFLYVVRAKGEDVLKFLLENMSQDDKGILNGNSFPKKKEFWSLLNDTVVGAEFMRERFEWNKRVPEILYFNEVSPYRSLTEPLFNFRRVFLNILLSCSSPSNKLMNKCLQNTNLDEKKLALFSKKKLVRSELSKLRLPCKTLFSCAAWASKISFQLTSPPIKFSPALPNKIKNYSLKQVIIEKSASCTGLAVYLVGFLRAVGIPARIVGVTHWNWPKTDPDWKHKSGNHNWVEVFLENGWNFIDQTQHFERFNSGWFYPKWTNLQNFKSGNYSIYAASYVEPMKITKANRAKFYFRNYAAEYFPLAWDYKNTEVSAWDVTMTYKTILKAVES
eukprot:snap_masked-scaffold_14-processed-gene-3.42-mRNA-1 protein AED:1.00 eAED:1.00 QI:0/-1/0/0/-1/1/1/0/341